MNDKLKFASLAPCFIDALGAQRKADVKRLTAEVKQLRSKLAAKEKTEIADSKKLAPYLVSKWDEIRKLEELVEKAFTEGMKAGRRETYVGGTESEYWKKSKAKQARDKDIGIGRD